MEGWELDKKGERIKQKTIYVWNMGISVKKIQRTFFWDNPFLADCLTRNTESCSSDWKQVTLDSKANSHKKQTSLMEIIM